MLKSQYVGGARKLLPNDMYEQANELRIVSSAQFLEFFKPYELLTRKNLVHKAMDLIWKLSSLLLLGKMEERIILLNFLFLFLNTLYNPTNGLRDSFLLLFFIFIRNFAPFKRQEW